MGEKLTYRDFERTGCQDADNTFDFDDVVWDSGNTAEEIVQSIEMMPYEDWIAQNDEDEIRQSGLDPKKAYAAWRSEWLASAARHIREHIRHHLTKAEQQFLSALQQKGVSSIEVCQDIALENNLKLTSLGEKFADIDGYYSVKHASSVGFFDLDMIPVTTWVKWEAEPDDRNEPGTFTLIMMYGFRGHEWNTRIGMSSSGMERDYAAALGLKRGERMPRADVNMVALPGARVRAAEYAWLAVKVFKRWDADLGTRAQTKRDLADIAREVADFDYREPLTPDEMFQNPSHRRNGTAEKLSIKQEESAVNKYREFNSFDPKDLVYVDGSPIPAKLRRLGEATQITYESLKVIPDNGVKPRKPQGYFHDHEGDVHTYVPDANGDIDTPDFVLECDALALIGTCLGYKFTAEDGTKGEGKATKPYPEVYCTPNGRALLVIQSKKTVLAIIYGGALGVESRGIVG